MQKKILCLALFAAMGAAHAAMAQDYDDRWYISGSLGENLQAHKRTTEDAVFGMVGVGKFFAPRWSFDLEFNYQDPKLRNFSNLNWTQYGALLAARYHFIKEGRNWWPYIKLGVGAERSKEDFQTVPNGPVFTRGSTDLATELGFGLQADYGRVDWRGEVGVRYVFDSSSVHAPSENQFRDFLASVGVTVALGPEPIKAVEPEPAPPAPVVTCADKDSDGDGVNDCNDKCPNSQAGQTVGPDGCPVPVTIDLKGVNFDFDKSTLRPDAVAILNEAVQVLTKYPDLKVEVAGHTDSIGTEAYNQKLSERRAKAVYDYLTSNGIDAARLIGPNGYGESRPIAPNTNPDGSDNPEGRAQNRRTELNVQN